VLMVEGEIRAQNCMRRAGLASRDAGGGPLPDED